MAVSLGNTTQPSTVGAITIDGSTIDPVEFTKQYTVGNFAPGMQVVFDTPEGADGYDTIHTVAAYDADANQLTLNEPITMELPTGTTIFKVYEGAHGTESEHLRKRHLGYI